MPLGTSYIVKSVRLVPLENSIIDRTCEALGDLERAQLMQEAALFEAFRLGVRFSAARPPPLNGPWPYLPERRGVTEVKVSVSLRVTVAELMSVAAKHVEASEALFLVGSTLAYVGRLQKHYQGAYAGSPAAARKAQAALQKIQLPAQYHYRGRS